MASLFLIKYNLFIIILAIEVNYINCTLSPSYQINLADKQILEISSDEDYDESENEMLQPQDLQDIEFLAEDESKYKPLHYHVENYNHQYDKKNAKKSKNILFHPIMERNINQESRPFISGFKHDLDKVKYEKPEKLNFQKNKFTLEGTSESLKKQFSWFARDKNIGYVNNNNMRIKKDTEEQTLESNDFFQGTNTKETTRQLDDYLSSEFTELPATEVSKFQEEMTTLFETDKDEFQLTESTTGSDIREDYDYEKLKDEYYQQIEEMSKRNELFIYTEKENVQHIENFTEKSKSGKNKTGIRKISKNCTKESFKIGIDFDCIVYDFKHVKDASDLSKTIKKTWKRLRIWLLLYVCVTTYCWCKKGWCCCCCCCEFCYPEEVIKKEMKYFAENPPGVLLKRAEENGIIKVETEEFKPTLFEFDAYDQMEQAIKKL